MSPSSRRPKGRYKPEHAAAAALRQHSKYPTRASSKVAAAILCVASRGPFRPAWAPAPSSRLLPRGTEPARRCRRRDAIPPRHAAETQAHQLLAGHGHFASCKPEVVLMRSSGCPVGPRRAYSCGCAGFGPGRPACVASLHCGSAGSGTGSGIAEDTHVPLVVDPLRQGGDTLSCSVSLRQVAPTILSALGLKPQSLDAVRLKGTKGLPDDANCD
jgi:hypothetical protein